MGGNVIAMNTVTGEETPAERIDLTKVGRQNFVTKSVEIFKAINKAFKSKFKYPLWYDESILSSGIAFNGSTSYIMNQSIPDAEVVKYKPTAGDIDLMVPVQTKEDLWNYLNSIQGKEIIPGVRYAGSNKPTISSIGAQINSVFVVDFKVKGTEGEGIIQVPVQVDFEFVPFAGEKPTEWARFSHSSSFEDAKQNIKAVHHKFLIRALMGGSSLRNDIVIATEKSTPDNITLTRARQHQLPRMLKFSVDRGVRVAYEPMKDEDGKIIVIDGKQVYRPIPTSSSEFETVVREIYKLAFQQLEGNESDVQKFNSFIGVVDLMRKYYNKSQIQDTTDRYLQLLWGFKRDRGQELERNDPEGDYDVKAAGYEYYIKKLGLPDERKKYIDQYYKDYRVTEVSNGFNVPNTIDQEDLIWESLNTRIRSLRDFINLRY